MHVDELRDPDEAYDAARDYLLARPLDHNLLHTILDQSRESSLAGRFWIVTDGTQVAGFALQSPPERGVVLGRMSEAAIHVLADAIEPPIPDVQGDATGAAVFAGRFAESHRAPVTGVEGRRLYELGPITSIPSVPGAPRLATADDRETLADWMRAFNAEVDDPIPSAADARLAVDVRLGRDAFWVWDHDGVQTMVSMSGPAGGVARVGPVYTPPESRGSGYATACVHYVSRLLTDRGLRCVLYTDLANPTSNAIYQRIGYRAIAEILRYEFGG